MRMPRSTARARPSAVRSRIDDRSYSARPERTVSIILPAGVSSWTWRPGGTAAERLTVRQKKADREVRLVLFERTRKAVDAWLQEGARRSGIIRGRGQLTLDADGATRWCLPPMTVKASTR